ncbi:amidohydrolase family protein [Paucihalobacter sp.]|uniref:amidohydrolase family protein n=1 Tax=Paucihalobacter sp. TaxID=2850405 RepID=UPI002FDF91D7
MTSIIHKIIITALLIVSSSLFAQQTPAAKQADAISITGVTAHIGNGSVIENATIIFENGIITEIGTNISTKGTVINANGKHVYPGFIVVNSTLGLGEVDAVRASMDVNELGNISPNIRSLIAYNAESRVVESMRPNGVLLGQIVPRGGRLSGTSSVVQFDAWNWEDAEVKVDDALHMNWPNGFTRGRWWLDEPSGFQPNKSYAEDIEKFKEFFVQAQIFAKATPTENNLAFEAVQGLFDGSKKLFVSADSEKEIIDAITFIKEIGIKNVVLVGGYHAYKIIDFLKSNNIPVVVGRTQSTPNFEDDDYDLPYKLPKLLHDAGLLVTIDPGGRMERMNTRNLPFYAGQVVGQGMEKEDALKMITSNAAKILGIDDKFGTLEVGKSATLFIANGDALDMRGNIISHAFIDGRAISLESHHTTLYKRYSDKFNSEN